MGRSAFFQRTLVCLDPCQTERDRNVQGSIFPSCGTFTAQERDLSRKAARISRLIVTMACRIEVLCPQTSPKTRIMKPSRLALATVIHRQNIGDMQLIHPP